MKGRSVNRRMMKTLRASATAIAVATTTMALASTQPQSLATRDVDLTSVIIHGTADNPTGDAIVDVFDGELKHTADGGLLYANYLGGPIGIYGALHSDAEPEELSTGDGPLAASPASSGPYHVGYQFDSGSKPYLLNVFTEAQALNDGSTEQALRPDAKPAVDDNGNVDCTGALTCQTDPTTHLTTVTYPDGVVAVVEKLNDITLVTYKTASELGRPDTLRQPAADPQPAATPRPAAVPNPAPADIPPAKPAAVTPSSVRTGPRLNVIRPAPDFSPGRSGSSSATPAAPADVADTVRVVTGVVDSVADAVSKTVNKVLNPGASRQDTGVDGG